MATRPQNLLSPREADENDMTITQKSHTALPPQSMVSTFLILNTVSHKFGQSNLPRGRTADECAIAKKRPLLQFRGGGVRGRTQRNIYPPRIVEYCPHHPPSQRQKPTNGIRR